MKLNNKLMALASATALSLSGQAFAAGTTAGTTVSNSATLNFEVSGTAQTPLTSEASFQVDNRVDMTIATSTASEKVVPGETVTFSYSLANTGNATQIFEVSIVNSADAGADDGDIVFTGTTIDTVANGVLTNNNYIEVAEDATATFNVTVTVPLVRDGTNNIVNADEFILLTKATAVADDSGTALVNGATTDKNDAANLNAETLIVLADSASTLSTSDVDAAYNGSVSVLNTAEIEAATFTYDDGSGTPANGVGISVLVVNDPLCNGTYTSGVATCDGTIPGYTPKAIPDATVEYTITATNSGTVSAESVVITQDLGTLDAGDNVTADLLPGSLSNITTTHGTTGTSTGDTLTVNAGTILATETVTVTFTAVVE